MIRADDGKTADVHPDEVDNWSGYGWMLDEARDRAQIEETERREREASEEAARAEAERLATEEEAQHKAATEEAARQAASIAALVAQQALEAGAPAAGAPPQSEGAAVVEPGTATGQPIAGTETDSASAPEPGAPDLTVAKGPRGLFFLKAGDTIVSKGFPTEEEAAAAVAELSSGGAQ
jgi:hypothetical protein